MADYNSPTLISIRQEEINPPPASTSCRTCPSSMWLTTPDQMPTNEEEKVLVKCFCKVMHCITWDEDRPAMPAACDGQAIGQALLQMKREEADE